MRLPERQQTVYRLSREQGLSRDEIACQLSISPNTVKNHLLKAVQFMKDHIQTCGLLIVFFVLNNFFFIFHSTKPKLRDLYNKEVNRYNMSFILKTAHLSHQYARSWAIRDINIEIEERGIIGLLGSNGAGKSTTMNIICGVLNQTEGEVYIDGIDLRREPEQAKKQIGFLPQTPPLYTDLTIDEYLTYSAQLRLMDKEKIKPAVEEVKERCGITHFSSRLIKNLSGGYRQRVGIAQAIIHKPKLVVMDEPTNGLDPNQLIEARKLIKEIAREHTVLLSSHILSEINLLCREIIMIEAGNIVFADTMDAFNNYVQAKTILMRLESPPLTEELLKVPGVTNVEFLSDQQIRVHFDNNHEDVSDALVAASVAGGWRLREITLDKGLLDDVFKHLSTQASA
jgi:ABC-2 type transport system ATP-binding protein